MARTTGLPFETALATITAPQLWVLSCGCLISFPGAFLVAFSVAVQKKVLFTRTVLRILSFCGMMWSVITFVCATQEIYLRYSHVQRSDGDVTALNVLSVFHEWFEWSSMTSSTTISLSLVYGKMSSEWQNVRRRAVTCFLIWSIPLCFLLPVVLVSLISGPMELNGVAVTPLVHGTVMVLVVAFDATCFFVVSLRLKRSYNRVKKSLPDSFRAAASRSLWLRDLRLSSFVAIYILCWSVTIYLSFSDAFHLTDSLQEVKWLFVVLTPLYWCFVFLAYAHGRYRLVVGEAIGCFGCMRWLFGSSEQPLPVEMGLKIGSRRAPHSGSALDTPHGPTSKDLLAAPLLSSVERDAELDSRQETSESAERFV